MLPRWFPIIYNTITIVTNTIRLHLPFIAVHLELEATVAAAPDPLIVYLTRLLTELQAAGIHRLRNTPGINEIFYLKEPVLFLIKDPAWT